MGTRPLNSTQEMRRFHPVDRQTVYLLPPSVDEWLPEDHLARFIVEVVDGLDLGALEKAYAGQRGVSPVCAIGVAGLWFRQRRVLEPED